MEEEPVKEQPSSAAASSGNSARPKLQRYPLRSVTKSKEEKPSVPNSANSSDSKRGGNASSVSKSVGVLDFSVKDKSGSAKPPRRFSNPGKASPSPGHKVASNITPISETRTGRTPYGQGRSKTPISEISKTSSRVKSNLLTSPSYWLNQIKLSESAGKHSISLGFFKLALEAGCEPLKSMQEELKSYVSKYQLAELGEPLKQLLERYNISEITEQLQVSETISQLPEDGNRSSDDDVHSSSSMGARKLKPKCLNIDSTQLAVPAIESDKKENIDSTQLTTPAIESDKKEDIDSTQLTAAIVSDKKANIDSTQLTIPAIESDKKENIDSTQLTTAIESDKKENIGSTQFSPSIESKKKETSQKCGPGTRLRGKLSTKSTTPRPALETGNCRVGKKSEKPSKQGPSKEKSIVRKQGKKSDVKEVPVSTPKGNKENKDVQITEEISMVEAV